MADQVTKILIRKGTLSEKNTITLNEAELGYTTDQQRVFVGNGVDEGGVVIGNKYLGNYSLTTDTTQLSFAEQGDLFYNTDNSSFMILSGTGTSAENWSKLSNRSDGTMTRLDAGNGIIFNSSDTFVTATGTVNLNVDSTKLNPLTTSSNGILVNFDIIYPVESVIMTNTNVNPIAAGGILEGSGQVWETAGTVTTSSQTVYTWKRTG